MLYASFHPGVKVPQSFTNGVSPNERSGNALQKCVPGKQIVSETRLHIRAEGFGEIIK